MSGLLFNAFRALGPAATWGEIATVAGALRDSGDVEVGRLLDNPEDWERCVELAEEAGANGFVALDLAIAFRNPRAIAKLVPPEQTGAVD